MNECIVVIEGFWKKQAELGNKIALSAREGKQGFIFSILLIQQEEVMSKLTRTTGQ
jgi:hypothetical protein